MKVLAFLASLLTVSSCVRDEVFMRHHIGNISEKLPDDVGRNEKGVRMNFLKVV